jgi:DNA polymerase-3 subunit epsilon
MRQIFIDTETTGLDFKLGHRIIEIAAVEMRSRRLTGRRFHYYLNPERDIEAGALQVHGLTFEFLQDKRKFREIGLELLEFVEGAELIIHNAAFDVSFIDHELSLAELSQLSQCCHSVTDTLKMAKELYPGKKNGLDVCDAMRSIIRIGYCTGRCSTPSCRASDIPHDAGTRPPIDLNPPSELNSWRRWTA